MTSNRQRPSALYPPVNYYTAICFSADLGETLTALAAKEGFRVVHINGVYNDNIIHVTYYYETLAEEEDRLYPPRYSSGILIPSPWDDPEPDHFVTPGQPDVPLDRGFDENVMDEPSGLEAKE